MVRFTRPLSASLWPLKRRSSCCFLTSHPLPFLASSTYFFAVLFALSSIIIPCSPRRYIYFIMFSSYSSLCSSSPCLMFHFPSTSLVFIAQFSSSSIPHFLPYASRDIPSLSLIFFLYTNILLVLSCILLFLLLLIRIHNLPLLHVHQCHIRISLS